MRLRCGFCKQEFEATDSQARRSRWPSTQPRYGYMCSSVCLAMCGVASRKVAKRLSPRKLAYSRVNNAIECGKLVRPECCSRCGKKPDPDRLGRSRIEAHHEDHSKALEVVWLCDACHKDVSPHARGERSGSAKFTEKDVRRIRAEFLTPFRGLMRKLTEKYGVTRKAIADVRDRKTWGHVL